MPGAPSTTAQKRYPAPQGQSPFSLQPFSRCYEGFTTVAGLRGLPLRADAVDEDRGRLGGGVLVHEMTFEGPLED